jgi:DNA repair photolyase
MEREEIRNLNKVLRVVYEPAGKAREYADLALNLYRGCGHGCVYCYAPKVLHMKQAEFFEKPTPRDYIFEKLESDLLKMQAAGDTREVLMCFTCDPYQPLEKECKLTRRAIELFIQYGRRFNILTKGGLRSARDFDLLSENPELCRYGATLVYASDVDSAEYEPGAAVTSERIRVLKLAHEMGIKTWVSLEPVWSPEDCFKLLWKIHDFVDEVKIGKLNHHQHSKTVDWSRFKRDVSLVCEDLGCNYTLKKDLAVL